ncbi:MAG: hypothetical protein R3B91_18440 [Planctomycetaceae bacterium]
MFQIITLRLPGISCSLGVFMLMAADALARPAIFCEKKSMTPATGEMPVMPGVLDERNEGQTLASVISRRCSP